MSNDINEKFEDINTQEIETHLNNRNEISFNVKPWLGFFLMIVIAAVLAIGINYSVLKEYGNTLSDSTISKYSVNLTISDIEYVINNSDLSDAEKLESIQSIVNDLKDELAGNSTSEE